MTDAPTPQRAASAEERDAPVVHGFAINPPGGPDIFVEGNNRFCHEHAFLAYRKHALDRITAAEARAEEAEAVAEQFRGSALEAELWHADLIALARMYGEACWGFASSEDAVRMYGEALEKACDRVDAATADRDRLADEVARLRKFADFALMWCDRGPPHGGPGNEKTALDVIRHHPVLSAKRRALTATGTAPK